jgi:hypothetical protein
MGAGPPRNGRFTVRLDSGYMYMPPLTAHTCPLT